MIVSYNVKTLTDRYGMSVIDAAGTICPCGIQQGQTLGELSNKQIGWLASRVTSTKQSKEFRSAVKAARIIRAHRKYDSAVDKISEVLATAPREYLNDAKNATAICPDCKLVVWLPRRMASRRRVTCVDCGAELQAWTIVDEWLTIAEAAAEYKVAPSTIRTHLIDLVHGKDKSKTIIGRQSLEQWLKRRKRDSELSSCGVDVKSRPTCNVCGLEFRNAAAMRMHRKEEHENS